jgi:hypothetical protein
MNLKKQKNMLNGMKNLIIKNIRNELFALDMIQPLSKRMFRRCIESKVKNCLGRNFIDFENLSNVCKFEIMKQTLLTDPKIDKNSNLNSFDEINYEDYKVEEKISEKNIGNDSIRDKIRKILKDMVYLINLV